jgi:type II secretory pathway component PulF
MVRRAGEVTGERAERTLRTAVALMEPMLVLALGVVVAAVAAALLQAVYSVRPL